MELLLESMLEFLIGGSVGYRGLKMILWVDLMVCGDVVLVSLEFLSLFF